MRSVLIPGTVDESVWEGAAPEDMEPFADEVLAGVSASAERLRLQVARLAPHYRIALLTGEPETGKETVARELHRMSPVVGGAFVPMGVSEFAMGGSDGLAKGTVYLCGIEAVRTTLQGVLLEKLEARQRTGKGEVRLVVAAENDLKGLVAGGQMQPELYAKVGTLELQVAPLRERLEDLEGMVQAMLRRLGSKARMSDAAMGRLRGHDWPGNLQELWMLCRQVSVVEGEIKVPDLPLVDRRAASRDPVRLDEVMYRHVMKVLQRCAGNKLRAAEALGISRSTLYRMLETPVVEKGRA